MGAPFGYVRLGFAGGGGVSAADAEEEGVGEVWRGEGAAGPGGPPLGRGVDGAVAHPMKENQVIL